MLTYSLTFWTIYSHIIIPDFNTINRYVLHAAYKIRDSRSDQLEIFILRRPAQIVPLEGGVVAGSRVDQVDGLIPVVKADGEMTNVEGDVNLVPLCVTEIFSYIFIGFFKLSTTTGQAALLNFQSRPCPINSFLLFIN